MLSAKALYSNISDSPEELSFSQGDVLTVLEKDVGGLAGWWLCSVGGRMGIAPGNRLLAFHGSHGMGGNGYSHPRPDVMSSVFAGGVNGTRDLTDKVPLLEYNFLAGEFRII